MLRQSAAVVFGVIAAAAGGWKVRGKIAKMVLRYKKLNQTIVDNMAMRNWVTGVFRALPAIGLPFVCGFSVSRAVHCVNETIANVPGDSNVVGTLSRGMLEKAALQHVIHSQAPAKRAPSEAKRAEGKTNGDSAKSRLVSRSAGV